MNRRLLTMALVMLAVGQSTFGAVNRQPASAVKQAKGAVLATSAAGLRKLDPNDERNAAGLAFRQEKKAGATCPWANKNGRDDAPRQVAAASAGASESPKALPATKRNKTTKNRHRR